MPREVARYSRRVSPKFELATPELETLVQEANPDVEHEKQHRPQGWGKNKNKCETCGQPLPRWSGVCVNCVEKRKLIFRLIRYSFPFWHVAVPALALMMLIRLVSLYPTILSKEMVDNILLPAGTALTGATVTETGEPIPPPTWGHLTGIVEGIAGWLTLPVAGSWGHLVTIVLLMVSFNVFTMGASAVRGYMMAWVGQNITRVDFATKLMNISTPSPWIFTISGIPVTSCRESQATWQGFGSSSQTDCKISLVIR